LGFCGYKGDEQNERSWESLLDSVHAQESVLAILLTKASVGRTETKLLVTMKAL
jgi:hypothetical protein